MDLGKAATRQQLPRAPGLHDIPLNLCIGEPKGPHFVAGGVGEHVREDFAQHLQAFLRLFSTLVAAIDPVEHRC